MFHVDINSDVGESFGNLTYGRDVENMEYLTSVNVACGFHSGDPTVMRRTVEMAHKRGIAIGVHPGLPDLQGFGRRKMDVDPEEAHDFILYQIGSLDAFARVANVKLTHVALHGALSGMCKTNEPLARAIITAIKEYNPELIFPGMPGLASYEIAKEMGLKVACIVPIDLDFRKDGQSIIERKKTARDPKVVARKALKLVTTGKLETVDGVDKEIKVDMLLMHGDGATATEIMQEVRNVLTNAGVKIEPFPNFV